MAVFCLLVGAYDRSFFNDSSTGNSFPLEFNNVDSSIQSDFLYFHIFDDVSVVRQLNAQSGHFFREQIAQVDGLVELLEGLKVVLLQIDQIDLYQNILHVFYLQIQDDFFG